MCNTCNKCSNEIIQYVPQGYGHKAVPMKCGDTSIYGNELICEACEDLPPWYICQIHGTNTSEYDCPHCG